MQADGDHDRNWERPEPDPGPRRPDAASARIDRALIRAHDPPGTASLADGIDAFARRVWSVPTFARLYATHQGAIGAESSVALSRALRRLEGKFLVANQRCAVS